LLCKYCKEKAFVVTYFWVSTQKIRKYKKKCIKKYSEEIKKKIETRKGCWNAHKMTRNWLRRFKNTRIEI
jgi:hypothetical protein